MIQVTINLLLFRTSGRNGAGRMAISSSDSTLRFYYYSWGIDGNHSFGRTAPLIFDVCQRQCYYTEVYREGEREQVTRLVGSVNWNGFEVEEDEGCLVTLEQDVLSGVYYEGRAFADPLQLCVCCGYIDYRQGWSRGCECNLVQWCSSCRKCQEHCACILAITTSSWNTR